MSNNTYSAGIGPAGLLGVAFVILKLIGTIDWSWWLVTLPFWGPAAFLTAVGLVILLAWGVISLILKAMR